MSESLTIEVLPDDRWDLIAHRQYGDPFGYMRILQANPPATIGVPAPILTERRALTVPIIEAEQSVEEVPPWLR